MKTKNARKNKFILGHFESIWDGATITTDCKLHSKTGELFTKPVDVKTDLGSLESERFYTDDDVYDEKVCPVCHEYIIGSKMVPGIGHDLNEEECCKNPDCESN